MKLPGRERAWIPDAKIRGFLLSPSHPVGGPRARFFIKRGFLLESWETLAESLLRHASEYEVHEVEHTEYGTNYVIEGELPTPDGRNPNIHAVWMIRTGEQEPRFVTAYPRVKK